MHQVSKKLLNFSQVHVYNNNWLNLKSISTKYNKVKLNILIDLQASLELSIRIEKLKQFKSNNMLYIQI